MSTGQMLQTIGALALLSLLILNANRAVLGNTRTVYTGQYAETAVSMAQSIILDATTKEYDEKGISQPAIKDPTKFSDLLGPDAGESSVGFYDDIDDYNGYAVVMNEPTDTSATPVNYLLTCSVTYMKTDLSDVSFSKTNFKRITVTVSVPFADPALFSVSDTTAPVLRLSSIVSYH